MLYPNWKLWFQNLPGNEQGNMNMAAFSAALGAEASEATKISTLTEDTDTVFLAADSSRQVNIFHSPKNFGGTRMRPTHKVVSLIGFSSAASCTQIDLTTALANKNIVTPTVNELAACTTREEVAALELPPENGLVGFEGSNIFIPAPFARDAILNADTRDPFTLIPIVMATARAFDTDHEGNEDYATTAVVHADDLVAWLWSVGVGRIDETRYSVNPDDAEMASFLANRKQQCISGIIDMTAPGADADALRQLTECMALQNEESATANQLHREELSWKKENGDTKDRTRKLFEDKLRLIGQAAATSREDDTLALPASCQKFINAESSQVAYLYLRQQLKRRGFAEATCSHGTVQSLYHGLFQWADSLTPSNFTVFAFFESAANTSGEIVEDYLACQLVQLQGERKSEDKIKASLKQEVHVPEDYDSLGQQLQYYVAAAEIFFGDESLGVSKLRQLVILVGRNRKHFRDNIALDPWFPSKFLYSIDKRFQRWLQACEDADMSRNQVNDNLLDFSDLLESVLNSNFISFLPDSFKRISAAPSSAPTPAPGPVDKHGNKKRKPDDNANGENDGKKGKVKNTQQDDDFKPRTGESWAGTFASKMNKDRPTWSGNIKMCARWFIKGDCFDKCDKKTSHVPKDQVPADRKTDFLAFMEKCRSTDGAE